MHGMIPSRSESLQYLRYMHACLQSLLPVAPIRKALHGCRQASVFFASGLPVWSSFEDGGNDFELYRCGVHVLFLHFCRKNKTKTVKIIVKLTIIFLKMNCNLNLQRFVQIILNLHFKACSIINYKKKQTSGGSVLFLRNCDKNGNASIYFFASSCLSFSVGYL